MRYAGAPQNLSSGGFGSASGPVQGQQRAVEYGGYDQSIVEGFTNMGFSVTMVVKALNTVGSKKKGSLSEEEADRVVEALLG